MRKIDGVHKCFEEHLRIRFELQNADDERKGIVFADIPDLVKQRLFFTL